VIPVIMSVSTFTVIPVIMSVSTFTVIPVIMSVSTQDHYSMIWIGTGSGHIGLIDATKQSLVVLTHKYTTPVRSLLYINRKGEI
jgi:hypothetical protein